MAAHSSSRGSPGSLFLLGGALVFGLWGAWTLVQSRPLHVDSAPRTVTPRGDLADWETANIEIFEQNAPSVVHITSPEVTGVNRFGMLTALPEGTGTGFVWDDRGYVVTNYHVVQGRRSVLVRMRNLREYRATVVGADPNQDIAVLLLDDPPTDLRPVEIGTSNDLRTGQAVFAIGNPFGLDHTLTTGVISALDREIESVARTKIRGVIQVDAVINPGNSGGPLLDSAGRLIGMNTAIYSPTGASVGIGFAVPVDTINLVVPQLISGDAVRGTGDPGTVTRAVLGIYGRRLDTERGSYLMVDEVVAGSGAEQAGIRPPSRDPRTGDWLAGDIILDVAGTRIRSVSDIQRALAGRSPGETVDVRILRGLPSYDTGEMTVRVQLTASR